MKKIAILLGTSRYDGNTFMLMKSLSNLLNFEVFKLKNYNISFYDYEHNNADDDFISLVNELLEFDHIVFASPVYWYAMSAEMKVFFDRITDLLTIEKNVGRNFRGKECSILSTGTLVDQPSCFEETFKHTFEYLDMNYKGIIYCCCNEKFIFSDNENKILEYVDGVNR